MTNSRAVNAKVYLFSCTAHSLSAKINLPSSGDTVLDYFQRWLQSRGYRVLSLEDLERLVLFKSKDVMKVTQRYSGEAVEREG